MSDESSPDDDNVYDELEGRSWMDLANEVDRLRARVAELETAGDELAAAADVVTAGGVVWMQAEGSLIRGRQAWRAVRGER